ncbi:MAG TPA: IS1182 family transposase [Gammaproteobacteria bacterium]|nr:IS1182 family transposase [Gammaproteobacteria bacterium]
MKRYIEGEDRSQSVLFPERLDEYIGEDNPVRVIEVFVESLDLEVLGFGRTSPAATGRPGYHPATLLKLYIYGYLNRIASSRRLERESQRNVELLWLLGKLMPDFKTIADFRRDNGAAIRRVCAEFVVVCRKLKLLTGAEVVIDGSKFKAVNNRDKNFTRHKLAERLKQLEQGVGRYLAELERADRAPERMLTGRVQHLREKMVAAREQIRHLHEIGQVMEASPDGQVSLTDPDARSMATHGRGTGIVGYNVQSAVDTRHHLIVAYEVTNVGSDRALLTPMAERARQALGRKRLTALADRGYYSGKQIRACEEAGITPLVPKVETSQARKAGRFDRADFRYHPRRDEYECPAGERAIYRFTGVENGMRLHRYWASACPRCALKSRCTPASYRRITRWEHEAVLERMQRRLMRRADAARTRRQTVEHPFGTLKAWMGATHFLTKRLPNVSTEMSLNVLAYNMKRVMNIVGTDRLIEALEAG